MFFATDHFATGLFDFQWIPASRGVPRSKQKLMIVLHGRGDSRDAFRTIKQELRLPHFNYLILNAPRKYMDGFSWYALEPRHERGVRGARQRLFKLVDELEAFGWLPEDIFWMGHSQGALVAADLVLNHPNAFGGLVGVSGYVWFFKGWRARASRSGARRTPWLFTHGTRDRVILPAEIREDIEELSRSSLPVLYREFAKGHDFDYQREVPFIRKWIRHSRLRALSFQHARFD
jgi:phospholipase/carboxylesterase